MQEGSAQEAKAPLHWEGANGCLTRQFRQPGQRRWFPFAKIGAFLSSIAILLCDILLAKQTWFGLARLLASFQPYQTFDRIFLSLS